MGVIPQKLVVGFNNREETYTGKLGYVCYLKGKNNDTIHQKSLASWSDKNIPFEYYDNEPIEGFVLNKSAGGNSWGWNGRLVKARVYDPRGFEFEIDMENLLYILENTNSIKGKALEGEFVYGWMGSGSVSLIPVNSEVYKDHFSMELAVSKAKEQTPLKNNELVIGKIYVTRKEELALYTGEKYGLEKFINLGLVKDNKNKTKFEKQWVNLKSKTVYREFETQGDVTIEQIALSDLNNIKDYELDKIDADIEIVEYNDKYYKDRINKKIEIKNFIPNNLFINGIEEEFQVEDERYSNSIEYKQIVKFLKSYEFKIKYPELNLTIINGSYYLLMSDNYLIKTQLNFASEHRWISRGQSIINKNVIDSRYFEYLNLKTSELKYQSNSYHNTNIFPSNEKLKLVKEIIIK